jgi:lipoprotein-anchoring transpeptidase ErfK/SrfK
MINRRLLSVVMGVVVAAFLLAGCGAVGNHAGTATPSPAPMPSTTAASRPPMPPMGTAAVANVPRVSVRTSPGGPVKLSLADPRPSGGPLTFLVVQTSNKWLEVALPDRPNGSRGWISSSEVSLHSLEYSLSISTEQNTLGLYRNSTLVQTYSVATGTGGTPTPRGSFYLTELIAPTNSGCGPYAFGLSAYSDVLTSFGGGVGQIGLHGTDDAASIGRAVSHGSIRLSNADITTLATLLPLGTPVTIE